MSTKRILKVTFFSPQALVVPMALLVLAVADEIGARVAAPKLINREDPTAPTSKKSINLKTFNVPSNIVDSPTLIGTVTYQSEETAIQNQIATIITEACTSAAASSSPSEPGSDSSGGGVNKAR